MQYTSKTKIALHILGVLAVQCIVYILLVYKIPVSLLEMMRSLLSSPYFYPDVLTEIGEIRGFVWQFVLAVPVALLIIAGMYYWLVLWLNKTVHNKRNWLYGVLWCIPILLISGAVLNFITNALRGFTSTNDWSNHAYRYLLLDSIGIPFMVGLGGFIISFLIIQFSICQEEKTIENAQ